MAARAAAQRAAFVVWLPVALPLVTGMLRESSSALQNYVLCAPLVPGAIVPTLLGLDDAAWVVVAALATLCFYAAVAIGLHQLPRVPCVVLEVAVVLAVGFAAIGFANAVRA